MEPFTGLQSSLPLISLKEGDEDQLNGVVNMVIHNSQSSFMWSFTMFMNEHLQQNDCFKVFFKYFKELETKYLTNCF